MCEICDRYKDDNFVMENETCYAFFEEDKLAHGHMIVALKNHKEDYFSLTYKELEDIHILSKNCKSHIDSLVNPDGYNVCVNVGYWAGQGVNHCFVHIIPRYAGDMPVTKLEHGLFNIKSAGEVNNE